MPTNLSLSRNSLAKAVPAWGGLRADQRGNVAVMMALLLPILCGFMGVGFEITNWYRQTRAMQNAADSAALAAASNASSSYGVEADAVTAQYGFVNGSKNVTVTAVNGVTCPDGKIACYQVTINSVVPLYLSQVVGYKGDLTVKGQKMKAVSSTAMAERSQAPIDVCLLALDTAGTALHTNGAPKSDFTGCTVMSNSSATCNGSNLNAYMGIAVGTNGGGAGCGLQQTSNYPNPVLNPGCPTRCYDKILASDNAMSATALSKCSGSYPQYTKKNGYPTKISSVGTFKSFVDNDGNTVYVACGDTQLSANITLPAGKNSVVVVENGMLDLGGFTLSGTSSSVVFSGTAGSYNHYPTGTGTLDIQAPTSGDWSGVALYQDPLLAAGTGVDVSYAGNNPTWNLTGLVYLPESSVTMSGAINKSANGAVCMVTVIKDVLINGTGSIYAQTPDGSGCKSAGLVQPTASTASRAKLVN